MNAVLYIKNVAGFFFYHTTLIYCIEYSALLSCLSQIAITHFWATIRNSIQNRIDRAGLHQVTAENIKAHLRNQRFVEYL